MSVGVPKVEESTPVATKPVDNTTASAEPTTPVIPTDFNLGTTEPATETTTETHATPSATTEAAKHDTVAEATPATEGILGYKAPGLLKQFRFVKHFFWFSEEPITQQGLDTYIKNEKADVAHHNAAWAQETGKGVLFYTKRSEDKATPTGLILIAEASAITKTGFTDFSFKIGSHTHKFEAASEAERDSWVAAIQRSADESKDLKTDITGRDTYKKNVSGYATTAAVATPKKSLDATTHTNTATAASTEPAARTDTSSESSDDEHKKRKAAEKQAKKERSQSRKRNSVFGLFGKKDEEKTEKKVEKEHEKEVKKAEKEHIKEEKKVEAEHKKEEAKAEHDAIKAKDAAEAAAIAAAPAAVVPAAVKKEEERPLEEVTTPTEKKNKRASVFGGFFNKNKIVSPTTEKSEKDVVPHVPAKDEPSAVSETAPKLDEPIMNKPIDTAAVTSPVNTTTNSTPAAISEEPIVNEQTTTAEPAVVTPRTERKSFVSGLFKKHDKKEEQREDLNTNEETVNTPAVTSTTAPETAVAATETPAVETHVKDTEVAKEERPAREKRRTSLFGSFGTLKRKTEKSPAPESPFATSEETRSPDEIKREKSPLPGKLGGLFRKNSRANKLETAAGEGKTDVAATETKPAVTETSATGTPANATIIEPKTDSEIVGDFVPDNIHHTVHDAVTADPAEVKTTTTA
ncbi:hypothetical protein LTS08_007627 [Lithohypha guttulata]|nr:hypothetical protein LTS08_007627 [Lithohypha guttulata]